MNVDSETGLEPPKVGISRAAEIISLQKGQRSHKEVGGYSAWCKKVAQPIKDSLLPNIP